MGRLPYWGEALKLLYDSVFKGYGDKHNPQLYRMKLLRFCREELSNETAADVAKEIITTTLKELQPTSLRTDEAIQAFTERLETFTREYETVRNEVSVPEQVRDEQLKWILTVQVFLPWACFYYNDLLNLIYNYRHRSRRLGELPIPKIDQFKKDAIRQTLHQMKELDESTWQELADKAGIDERQLRRINESTSLSLRLYKKLFSTDRPKEEGLEDLADAVLTVQRSFLQNTAIWTKVLRFFEAAAEDLFGKQRTVHLKMYFKSLLLVFRPPSEWDGDGIIESLYFGSIPFVAGILLATRDEDDLIAQTLGIDVELVSSLIENRQLLLSLSLQESLRQCADDPELFPLPWTIQETTFPASREALAAIKKDPNFLRGLDAIKKIPYPI